MTDPRSINTEALPLYLIDDLTHLCNRRFIYNNMSNIITQNETFARKTYIFMVDVDNFKKINDTFGHLVGDMILIELARIMKESIAEKGIVARYAGDEFIILLPGQGEDEARMISQALLQDVSQFKLSIKGKDFVGQGLSIGSAVYPDDSTSLSELINCADQALYAAKKAGKNKMLPYKSVGKEIKTRTLLRQMLIRPPLINRKEELANFKQSCKEILKGAKKQGRMVEGKSGIGKTRLLEEFVGWAEKQNMFVLFCKLAQKEESGPLAVLAELLRLITSSLDADKFEKYLAKLDPSELAEIVYLHPAIKNIIKDAPHKTEPGRRAVNLFSGLYKILVDITGERMLVLAADDLNYANKITLQFFSLLLGISDAAKLLFIGSYTKENISEVLKDFLAKDIFTTIRPQPFLKVDVEQLIVSVFPGIKPQPELIENVFMISKGNPLLLCEILKALVEKGHIQYEGEQWKLKDIEAKDVPDSLPAAIVPVLGNLDDETKEMLATAAVIGEKIELDILKNLSGYREGRLTELLDRALNAGLIKSPDLNYDSLSFRTESARKALADTVPLQKSDLIHQKLAELISQRYKDELPTQLDRLIHHLDLAKDKDSSLQYKNLGQKLDEDFFLSPTLKDVLEKIGKLKETPVSIEELLERPLSKASTKIIREAILAIRAASIGTLLYPAGNAMRIDLENRAYELLLKILQNDSTMTISNVEGKTLVNGFAPKNVDVKNTLGFTLISLMEDYGMSSITFKRDLRREEFADFLHCLTNPEEESLQDGGVSTALKKRGVIHIKIDQVRYEKMSEIAKKAIGMKGTKGEGLPMARLSKDNLLDMPVEQYSDPAISGKLGLIAEALILSKNNEKVKNIVDKISGDLTDAANNEDKTATAEGAIRLSESLLIYEKVDLFETLIKALLNRFNNAQQSKEFTQLCDGLQGMAVQLINKGNFSQATAIINRFKEQIMASSARPQEQKKIVAEGLHKIAHHKVIEALISAFKEKLESDDYHNITEVLAALGEHALKPMLDILTREELEEKDPFELYVMRHSVAMILKKMGQPVKDALKRMLADNRNYVVKNVIEVIGYIGSEEFVPMLTPFLHAASIQIRMQCVVTLKKIGSRASLEALTEGLKDRNEEVKRAASLAIAELADQSFVKELRNLVTDKSTEGVIKDTIQKIQSKKKK